MGVDCSKLRSCYKIKTYKNSKESYQIKLQEQDSNQANKQTHKHKSWQLFRKKNKKIYLKLKNR